MNTPEKKLVCVAMINKILLANMYTYFKLGYVAT